MELINNKYILMNKIGSGCFGSIYKGQNIRTKEYVAIKIEKITDNLHLLQNEANCYAYLSNCKGIPTIKWFGKDDNNYYMVIKLLNVSLSNIMQQTIHINSIIILKWGIQIINIIKTIHHKGLIHRDIKPDNFLFGDDTKNNLYLIDFGFCKTYNPNNIDAHTHGTIGSKNYASINAHFHKELSMRDDLESVAYMLLKLQTGTLPWGNTLDENEIVKLKIQLKNDYGNYININNTLTVIIDFLNYIWSLAYKEMPNYDMIIDTFQKEINIIIT